MSKNIASEMDMLELKAFNNALNFLQGSKASTIMVSAELDEWLWDIRNDNSDLLRGITAKIVCDTSLEALVIHECNTENGSRKHDFTNLGDEDVDVEIARGNHD